MALCDTVSEVEKSATCEWLQGTQPHGRMLEKALSERRGRMGFVFVCVGWGGCVWGLGTSDHSSFWVFFFVFFLWLGC